MGFLLDSDTPLLSLLLPEDPGESRAFLQDTGAHPIPAGSVFIPLAFKPRNFLPKAGTCRKEPRLSRREAPSSSQRGLNRLLININPPNQSHAQKTLDEETQGGRGVSNFLLTSSGKLRAPLI